MEKGDRESYSDHQCVESWSVASCLRIAQGPYRKPSGPHGDPRVTFHNSNFCTTAFQSRRGIDGLGRPSFSISKTGFLLAAFSVIGVTGYASAAESFDLLSQQYNEQVRPLLTAFCLKCHSTEKKEG